MKVTKRNGNVVDFDKNKIIVAINKAAKEVDGQEYPIIAKTIADYIENLDRDMSVEEIQNQIEEQLMDCERKDIARAYIRYRYRREAVRKNSTEFIEAISEKLNGKKIENSNANMDENSFGGRIGEATNVMMRDYALNYCMSEMAKNNHLGNRIYIHDLNAYAVGEHNCLSIPFDDLLANGFTTRQTDIRPANSADTAFQLIAVIFQLQSLMQFGGVAATHLDWTMVPYVRKSFYKHYKDGLMYIADCSDMDKDSILKELNNTLSIEDEKYKRFATIYKYAFNMTFKEVNQGVESLLHNLNTLQSRSGNQLPFSSINYGTCTLPEGRMIIRALLEGSIKGVGKFHRTAVFPCQIFQCMKGVNRKPGDPNYDLFQLALKSTALRLYPNYCNVDWSVNAGYDKNDPRQYVSTMGLGILAHLKSFEYSRKRDKRLGLIR